MGVAVKTTLSLLLKIAWLGILSAGIGGCASGGGGARPVPDRVETVEETYQRLLGETGRTTTPTLKNEDDSSLDQRYNQLLHEIGTATPAAGQPPPASPGLAEPTNATTPQLAGSPSRTAPDGTVAYLTIQPEAVLRIRVSEDGNLNGNYVVNEIGAISFAYIGPIILWNMTEEQAAARIQEVLQSRDFRNATVTVEMLRASYDRVAVDGQVVRPGMIRIGAGDLISLNDALLRVGGLSGAVRGMQVRVLRGGMTNVLASVQRGEVYAMQDLEGRPTIPEVWLGNNDQAIVFTSRAQATAVRGDKEILLLGEVNRRGPIRFSAGEPATMMRLVFKMGGFPQYANQRNVRIVRRDDQGGEYELSVNVQQIMETGDPDLDVPLEDGDRIIVPARRISLF